MVSVCFKIDTVYFLFFIFFNNFCCVNDEIDRPFIPDLLMVLYCIIVVIPVGNISM